MNNNRRLTFGNYVRLFVAAAYLISHSLVAVAHAGRANGPGSTTKEPKKPPPPEKK